jgi:hypothetical protein
MCARQPSQDPGNAAVDWVVAFCFDFFSKKNPYKAMHGSV